MEGHTLKTLEAGFATQTAAALKTSQEPPNESHSELCRRSAELDEREAKLRSQEVILQKQLSKVRPSPEAFIGSILLWAGLHFTSWCF